LRAVRDIPGRICTRSNIFSIEACGNKLIHA
jgi:hypothetical protein